MVPEGLPSHVQAKQRPVAARETGNLTVSRATTGRCFYFAVRLWMVLGLLTAWTCLYPVLAWGQNPRSMFRAAREQMVDQEIVTAGVTHLEVIEMMRRVPRHEFVPLKQRSLAYFDMALPIGANQTISPPFVVAYMTEQLDPQPSDVVLEIGTGSGYQAAVLSGLVKQVYSIEIVDSLGRKADRTLKRLGYRNVAVKVGDGYQGWPQHAPFDKIIVTCSPEKVPTPLVNQLREGGRMIVPVGERYRQNLYLFTKRDGQLVAEALRATLFVPMTGAAEQRRQKQPDPARPRLENGGFEQVIGEPSKVAGWHYQRQVQVVSNPREAREGERYVTFTNKHAGRSARAMQGFAVDGRQVAELELALWVRGDQVRYGRNRSEWPHLLVTFFDERRAAVGQQRIGTWIGTFAWQHETARLAVPLAAREAIISFGLMGGVGEISFDDLRLRPASR